MAQFLINTGRDDTGGILHFLKSGNHKAIISHAICIVALSLLTILVYGNSLNNLFVYDDNLLVVGNPSYQYCDIWKIFFTPFSPANGVEYLPVRDATYALDYMLWGENPAGFHLSNLLIYLFTALVCYLVNLELLQILHSGDAREEVKNSRLLSFLITALFIVHPLHSQVVSFIIQRNALLSGLFCFLTIYCYTVSEHTHNRWGNVLLYVLSLMFCLFALFSKATSITLPALLLLITLFSTDHRTWTVKLLKLAPFFMMGLLAFLVISSVARHTHIIKPNLMEFGAYNLPTKLAIAVQIPYFYLGKLLFPFNLSPEYDIVFASNFKDFPVYFAIIVTIIIFSYCWKLRERFPFLLFSVCWFYLTLLPVLNLMPTQPVVADRYAYLPSYCFCFAISILFYRMSCIRFNRVPKLVWGGLLATLAVIAFQENRIWKDEKTLFSTMIQRSPGVSKGYANLGYLFFKENQYDTAFKLLQQAYQIDPTKPDYEFKHGMIAFRGKRFKEAIEYFKKALAINEQSMASHYFLGVSYLKNGDYESALQELQNVLESTEADTNSYRLKASFTMSMSIYPKLKPALDTMREALRKVPDDVTARRRLADTLLRFGMFDEALEQYREIGKRDNEDWQTLYSMAKIYRHRQDWQTAMDYLHHALAHKPDEGRLIYEMGLLNMAVHDTGEAVAWFERISPQDTGLYPLSRYQSAVCYFQNGNREMAQRYFDLVNSTYPELRIRCAPYLKKLAALP